METYFATAERSSEEQLTVEIAEVNNSVVISALMKCVGGLLGVVNAQRQVVALNTAFLNYLGIEDCFAATGLRPGEVLECVHARDEPCGCGTTRYCSTCGAAIAMVTCQEKDRPIEQTCELVINREGRQLDLVLSVRAYPLALTSHKYTLLFLQDITRQQQRAALERTFFHDISNVLNGLLGASELLRLRPGDVETVDSIYRLAARLSKDVALQKSLFYDGDGVVDSAGFSVSSDRLLGELEDVFTNHPAAVGRDLLFSYPLPAVTFITDPALYLRVACNMITNALEASAHSATVKVWFESGTGRVDFKVWNQQQIPENVALRVFQKNFTTKGGEGRGIGAYAMKLVGEKILGGSVTFSTSTEGTIFCFSLGL